MRIISCASYYGTGSSAITDFLSEFDNIYSLTNYEFRFVQDPDGISDLEYNLVENHNRHNSGHALKRFKRLTDFNSGTFFNSRYEPFFANQYKQISYEYIKSLTDFTFKGYWFYDFYDRGNIYYYAKRLPGKILSKIRGLDVEQTAVNAIPNEMTYCSRPDSSKFIRCTQEYMDKLFVVANKAQLPNIMVDQIVPPSNVARFTRYFKDIKVFVVDRDPRDIFILSKYVWKDRVIPTDTAEMFCKWYKYTREHRKKEIYNLETTMFIQFEDFIYHYNETANKILDFLGISKTNHIKQFEYFNPRVSMKNTQIWKSGIAKKQEITYIEKELAEYLYNFSLTSNLEISGV